MKFILRVCFLRYRTSFLYPLNYIPLNQAFLSLSRFIARIPGIATLADFSHKLQKNAPQEISMIMALKRPDECTMIMKLPEVSYTFFRQL